MEVAFLFATALLFAGFLLRVLIPLVQWLYLPASIVGGLVGLAAIQTAEHAGSSTAADVSAELKTWPGWLIAVVFAGLLLERKGKRFGQALESATREAIMVWVIVLGQVALGLLATALMLKPWFGVHYGFASLIETGFAGGHGTAAAMGDVFSSPVIAFAEGRDLGMFMATAGLVFSIVSGMLYVNVAVRWGWTRTGHVQIPRWRGTETTHPLRAIGWARVRGEVIDPLVFQALILTAAFAVGLGLQQLVAATLRLLAASTHQPGLVAFTDFPLFIYTLVGGWSVRTAIRWCGWEALIDEESLRRLTTAAMEYLVVAAVASLSLTAVIREAFPLTILLTLAFVWTGCCLLVISPRILPREYWFELGIINYGMSTGTTATGFVLLRTIDQDLSSGAAEDYALAAPLSSPFIGGGLVTLSLPYVLTSVPLLGAAILAALLTTGLLILGLLLAARNSAASPRGQTVK